MRFESSHVLRLSAAVALLGTACTGDPGAPGHAGIERSGADLSVLPNDVSIFPGDIVSIFNSVFDTVNNGQDLGQAILDVLTGGGGGPDLGTRIEQVEQRVIDLSNLVKDVEIRDIQRQVDTDRQQTLGT